MNERRNRDQTIYGIPCSLKSDELRQAIRIVLRQIRQRAPEDFRRIQVRVRRFAPWSYKEKSEGNLRGSFRQAPYDFETPGVVNFPEGTPLAISIIAHELGHACTREKDWLERRDALGAWDEFIDGAGELCANYYAYKWGFGRRVGKERRFLTSAHRRLAPGSFFTVGPDGRGVIRRYRIDRRFRIRLVSTRKVSAEDAGEVRDWRKVRILRLTSGGGGRFRCLTCSQVWKPEIGPNGMFAPGWWKCPNGCNFQLRLL
jgi:hypothetical protein